MKALIIIIFLASVASFGQVKDEQKIKKTIVDETESYAKGDMEAWSNCLTKSEKMAYIFGMPDGSTGTIVGFENIQKTILSFIEENPNTSYQTKVRDNWNININGNTAWATYNEISMIDGKEEQAQEIRVLKKIDGEWKLDLISFIY